MKIFKLFLSINIIFIIISCGYNKSFRKIKDISTKYSVIISGFENDKYGVSLGLMNGEIYITKDGGKIWKKNTSFIKTFSMDILNEKILFINGISEDPHHNKIYDVLKITDGKAKWDYLNGNIKDIIINNNYYTSFLNENTGWLASDKQLCVTKDGYNWTNINLPSEINRIAAINLISENNSNENGVILDENGNLYKTIDSGMTWDKKNLNLKADEKIFLSLKGNSNYIRFKDMNTGLIAIALKTPEKKLLIYKTNDGGNSFSIESINFDFKTSINPVYLYISRDLNFITISSDKKIVCYKNSKL